MCNTNSKKYNSTKQICTEIIHVFKFFLRNCLEKLILFKIMNVL